MKTYAYDIECLSNLFTVTFVNVDDEEDKIKYYIGLDNSSSVELERFLLQKIILVGYNSHSYDDPMLRFILQYNGVHLLEDLNTVSAKLVSEGFRSDKEILALRYPRNVTYPWYSIDLMRMLGFDKLGISLKQVSINLKWKKIQDMPIHHTEKVTQDQLSEILGYNLNDVLITKELYHEVKPLLDLRKKLSKIYSVDLLSASDSRMANLILENIYANELRMDIRAIKDMRTVREKVLLKNCIVPFVSFKTPELKELLDRIKSTYVYRYNRYKYNETIHFAGNTFRLGVGGLHTDDAPGIFETDDKYIIQDMDVASYYPNLIINNNLSPKHLGKNFIDVLKKITKERLEAKEKNDKVKADGLKITINSIFGKLAYENFWLLDALPFLSTTVSGQLGLLMLVEDLYLNGINVISANTDGIICQIPRGLEETYYKVADEWERKTNLVLEYTPYKKYVRRDVNSYITEKADGSTKQKGAFLMDVDLKRGYRMPIVAKALHAYFIQGVPVDETLENSKDIMDFCLSQKTGASFVLELHTIKGVQALQKTNRYFISKKGGSLIKHDFYGKRKIGMHVSRMATVLNDYDTSVPFEKYGVDLSFYKAEIMKLIDEVEPKQMRLFDLASLGQSSLRKDQFTPSEMDVTEELITVKELNKLGKNQLVRKMEDIVRGRQTVTNISSRYVFVLDFSERTMIAEIYCLAKGIFQELSVDKKTYKKNKIEQGHLIYCKKFKKLEFGHELVDYNITDKIEEDIPQLIESK